jgi:large subunit ribosomal protein L24
MAARIKKDDVVMIVSGDHKGERGRVLRVIPKEDRVVIEGVNMVWKHVRRSQRNPQGARLRREAPVHVSNVMPIDPRTDKPVRVKFNVVKDSNGKIIEKQRVTAGRRSSGAVLSDVVKRK